MKLFHIILAVITLLLLINLFYPLQSLTGHALYYINAEEPTCFAQDKELNIDTCCQLKHRKIDQLITMNQKALQYCSLEGYDVT